MELESDGTLPCRFVLQLSCSFGRSVCFGIRVTKNWRDFKHSGFPWAAWSPSVPLWEPCTNSWGVSVSWKCLAVIKPCQGREIKISDIATYMTLPNSNSCFNAVLWLSHRVVWSWLTFLSVRFIIWCSRALPGDTFQPQSRDVTARLYLTLSCCAQTLSSVWKHCSRSGNSGRSSVQVKVTRLITGEW